MAPAPVAGAWRVPTWLERATGWTWRLLVLAAGLYVTMWLLGRLRIVLVPVLIALLLTALVSPLTNPLARRGVPRLAIAWIALLVAVLIVGGAIWLTASSVGQELSNGDQWAQVENDVRQWLRDGPASLSASQIDDIEQRVRDTVVGGVRSSSFDRVRLATEMVGAMFLTVVLFFFFVKDGPSLWEWISGRFKPARRTLVASGGRAAFGALQGYMKGVAITGVVDGVVIGLALWLIGVPLVIPLAILTFFGAFFPIVGATAAGALAAVVALVTNGPGDAVLVVLATLVVQQVEGDLIMPIVMRRQVQLHPVVILVALAIGGAIAGLVGAFVAVPIAAMLSAAGSTMRAEGRLATSAAELVDARKVASNP